MSRSVPYCYPALPKELAGAFAGNCGYESHGNRMKTEAVLVATDPDPVGFVHVGEAHDHKEDLLRVPA